MNAHDIIIKPVLTEKSYEAIQNKTYVFIVAKKAGKTEGRRPSTKKAYITLTKDSKTIEAFDNMAQ